MGDNQDSPERRISELRSRSPGEHRVDPYNDVDVLDLPSWWQEAIEEFEAHDLRPYQPARFEDDVPVKEVVNDLESELDIAIEFYCYDPESRSVWTVRIDDKDVYSLNYRRSPDGYSVLGLDSDEFEVIVRTNT